jgi:hypothetical protein
MKTRISNCYSRGGFLARNKALLLPLSAILVVSFLAAGARAQSDMGNMTMPSDAKSTMKSPMAKAQTAIELTTDPTPPKKGSNTVRVKLTSKDGKLVEGAKVTVTFFMAAMPDMGMAAMKKIITASDKGGGSYEGKGDIGSGGDWEVTVKASKNGHIVATRKLTLNVAGGM